MSDMEIFRQSSKEETLRLGALRDLNCDDDAILDFNRNGIHQRVWFVVECEIVLVCVEKQITALCCLFPQYGRQFYLAHP